VAELHKGVVARQHVSEQASNTYKKGKELASVNNLSTWAEKSGRISNGGVTGKATCGTKTTGNPNSNKREHKNGLTKQSISQKKSKERYLTGGNHKSQTTWITVSHYDMGGVGGAHWVTRKRGKKAFKMNLLPSCRRDKVAPQDSGCRLG